MTRPKQVLTTLTLLGVIYTASISGGYGLEGSVAAGGPLLTIVFLCLIPLVWGIPVSVCVAEMACAVPSNAGPIMWVNVAFPGWFTFSTAVWTAFLNFVDNSLYPTLFADYFTALWKLDKYESACCKIVFIWFCALINMLGAQVVGVVSVIIMFITVFPFAVMFVLQVPHGFDWERISYVPPHVNWALFLPVVCWNFSGFDSAANVIEEVKKPVPTFVNALLLMVLAGLATYVPPVLVGASAESLKNVPWEEWTDGFWIRVAQAVGGVSVGHLVMIGSTISTVGLMTTLLTTTSRSLAGMGSIGTFPAPVSRWISEYHPRLFTPVNSTIVVAFVTTLLSIFLTFDVLVSVDQILYAVRLCAILMAFLVLRVKHPNLRRPYSVPCGGNLQIACLWGIVPLLFSVGLIIVSALGDMNMFIVSVVIIVGTLVVSYLFVDKEFSGAIVYAEECAVNDGLSDQEEEDVPLHLHSWSASHGALDAMQAQRGDCSHDGDRQSDNQEAGAVSLGGTPPDGYGGVTARRNAGEATSSNLGNR